MERNGPQRQASNRGSGFTPRDRLLVPHPHGRAGTGNLQTPVGCCHPGSGHRHAGRCGVGNVPLYLGRGGIWSRKGLMWKAAPAGQGEALLHQLRKDHPGHRLFIRHFTWVTEKRGGGARGKKKNQQVHFCLYIFTKYIYLFTYKKAFFFLCKSIVLFCLSFLLKIHGSVA